MKAIHNAEGGFVGDCVVVYDPAKLVKMKAIHNEWFYVPLKQIVVYDPAKLVKMKAIHNGAATPDRA